VAPKGVPCCDIATAIETEYDVFATAHRGSIEGSGMAVQERAISRDSGKSVPSRGVVTSTTSEASSSVLVPADAV